MNDLQEERIAAFLRAQYGLRVVQVTFLPLGADRNTTVYRVLADEGRLYFLKLRSGFFDETSVALPRFLSEHGIAQIIAPLTNKSGQPWARLNDFIAILYPFVEGRDGYEIALSARQWADFGTTLKAIHTAGVPPALTAHIQQETYSSQWRVTVRKFLVRTANETFADPVAARLALFLQARRAEILDLVSRAERLALALQARSPEYIVCHSDLHAGNILMTASGSLYIVDWDNPILAPKERDLMFIGGGQFGNVRTPQEEETLFYQGYGQTQLDAYALAYYRYERIVEDIAAFCEQLLLNDDSAKDREQSLRYLISNFLPGNTMAIAYQSDKTPKR
jgi:spectinomycin phosphotransferase